MRKLVIKDKKLRKLFLRKELKVFILRSMNKSQLSFNMQSFNLLNLKSFLVYKFLKLNQFLIKKNFKIRIRNRCIYTGRSLSIMRLFRISRQVFRSLVSLGFIIGVRKSSW